MWSIGVEILPDGSKIITREAWKALIGLPFLFFREGEDKATEAPAVSISRRDYYLELFTRCENFGLPQGKGWAHEPEWLISLLESLKIKKSAVEAWVIRGRK